MPYNVIVIAAEIEVLWGMGCSKDGETLLLAIQVCFVMKLIALVLLVSKQEYYAPPNSGRLYLVGVVTIFNLAY